MSESTAPYVERSPGDLLTAEDWNTVQTKIHEDIRAQSQAAADSVTHVANADDSASLEGKDLDALTDEIVKRVRDDLRGQTGYQQLFKVLHGGDVTVIEHNLGTMPLVDLYKLEYFQVVCREDDETRLAYANFYLHNAEERRVRVTDESGTRVSVDIQPQDGPELGIPFADMLTRYDVGYTETTSLDDLVTEFWQAFFSDPNDRFDDDQYCYSPWFERCCKEQQPVRRLKQNGDWDDMIFQFRPRKSVNYPTAVPAIGGGKDGDLTLFARPANTFVQHLDNNRTAVWFLGSSVHDDGEEGAVDYIGTQEFEDELKLMVLLKV